MPKRSSRTGPLTRRGALQLLGGVGLLAARCGAPGRPAAPLEEAAVEAPARRGSVTFPDGAIIRTVLSDLDPEALAHGATLFHEHLSLSDPVPPWLPPPTTRWGRSRPTSI